MARYKVRTIGETLACGEEILDDAGLSGAVIESQIILSHVTGLRRDKILAELKLRLNGETFDRYVQALNIRTRGYPLQYITNKQEFWSLEFYVDERVMIPRPETEMIIEETLDRAGKNPRIADIGTGSGCIAVALAAELSSCRIDAVDICREALEVARINAERQGVLDRICFYHGDLFGPFIGSGECYDFILSNPPYIPQGEKESLQKEVRDFEPGSALFSGEDGMETINGILAGGRNFLRTGGVLMIELSHDGCEKARKSAEEYGWRNIAVKEDYNGAPRVLIGEKH